VPATAERRRAADDARRVESRFPEPWRRPVGEHSRASLLPLLCLSAASRRRKTPQLWITVPLSVVVLRHNAGGLRHGGGNRAVDRLTCLPPSTSANGALADAVDCREADRLGSRCRTSSARWGLSVRAQQCIQGGSCCELASFSKEQHDHCFVVTYEHDSVYLWALS